MSVSLDLSIHSFSGFRSTQIRISHSSCMDNCGTQLGLFVNLLDHTICMVQFLFDAFSEWQGDTYALWCVDIVQNCAQPRNQCKNKDHYGAQCMTQLTQVSEVGGEVGSKADTTFFGELGSMQARARLTTLNLTQNPV